MTVTLEALAIAQMLWGIIAMWCIVETMLWVEHHKNRNHG